MAQGKHIEVKSQPEVNVGIGGCVPRLNPWRDSPLAGDSVRAERFRPLAADRTTEPAVPWPHPTARIHTVVLLRGRAHRHCFRKFPRLND